MKTIKNYMALVTVTIVSMLSLSSCDDAWWNGYDDLTGTWRIVEAEYNNDYVTGDTWTFDASGIFYADGDNGFYQRGEWDLDGRSILIRFDDTPTSGAELVCYVRGYEGDYIVLDVEDYGYGTSYTLRLVREYYYSKKK